MIEDPRHQTQQTSGPRAKEGPCAPAEQPKLPKGSCPELPPAPQPPALPRLEECELICDCPEPPPATHTCLEDLIATEAKEIKEAELATPFKADLEALLAKARQAQEAYTWQKYEALLAEWKKQDAQIAELIRKLVCAFPCWRCLVECAICRLIYAVSDLEKTLNGSGTPYTTVDSLYDLKYWHQRNRDARQAIFDRVKAVLDAWEKPAETIEQVLAANAQIIDNAKTVMAPDAQALVYDVFMRLVPMHLAIAPTPDVATTTIERQYADLLCPCDKGTADDCCGPDVGAPSLRDRLIGPQPYLIAPDRFLEVLCCLAKERYRPAKQALAAAKSAVQDAEAKVQTTLDAIARKEASLENDAKTELANLKCDEVPEEGECGCSRKHGRTRAPAPVAVNP